MKQQCEDSTMARNRTVYDAKIAASSCDGTQIRIVKRHQPDSPLETVQHVETVDVEQARELRDTLGEAIARA
jgi:hypothetical protein